MKKCCVVFVCFLMSQLAIGQSLLGGLMYDESLDDHRPRKPLDVVRMVQEMTNTPIKVDASFPKYAGLSDVDREWAERAEAASSLRKEGKLEEASAAFRTLLDERPDNQVVKMALADNLYTRKQFSAAEKMYQEVVDAEPLNFMALNNLAWLYATASDLSYRDGIAAIQNSKLALVRAPANFHIWSTLAEAYYISSEYEDALHAATQALYFAEKNKADDRMITYYLQQVEKARAAHLATSILE